MRGSWTGAAAPGALRGPHYASPTSAASSAGSGDRTTKAGTAAISFLIAGALTVLSLNYGMYFIALLFGMSAFQSFNRFRTEPDITAEGLEPRRPRVPLEDPIPGELLAQIRRARRALADEKLDEASALADQILARDPAPPKPAVREAFEVLGWSRLLSDDVRGAAAALAQAKRLGEPDRALVAAVHRALGEIRQARRVLEEARSDGDDRKEIVGPLIQILIEQGEVPRAAALALDIVDALSEEDARRMGEIAFEHGAFEWSAHLYEAVFRRNGEGEDAYGAARASAKDGNHEKALELLRRAVEAGFSDRARAWSDAALEPLQNGPLDTVLPRP
jgi:tetratricopeptide (TPR) repeat protein